MCVCVCVCVCPPALSLISHQVLSHCVCSLLKVLCLWQDQPCLSYTHTPHTHTCREGVEFPLADGVFVGGVYELCVMINMVEPVVCVCVCVSTCSKARTAPPSMPVSHFCRCLFFFKRGEEARNSHHLCSAWLRAFPSDRLSLCFYLSVFFSMLHSNRCCHFVIGLLLRHARWKGNHPCLISF